MVGCCNNTWPPWPSAGRAPLLCAVLTASRTHRQMPYPVTFLTLFFRCCSKSGYILGKVACASVHIQASRPHLTSQRHGLDVNRCCDSLFVWLICPPTCDLRVNIVQDDGRSELIILLTLVALVCAFSSFILFLLIQILNYY